MAIVATDVAAAKVAMKPLLHWLSPMVRSMPLVGMALVFQFNCKTRPWRLVDFKGTIYGFWVRYRWLLWQPFSAVWPISLRFGVHRYAGPSDSAFRHDRYGRCCWLPWSLCRNLIGWYVVWMVRRFIRTQLNTRRYPFFTLSVPLFSFWFTVQKTSVHTLGILPHQFMDGELPAKPMTGRTAGRCFTKAAGGTGHRLSECVYRIAYQRAYHPVPVFSVLIIPTPAGHLLMDLPWSGVRYCFLNLMRISAAGSAYQKQWRFIYKLSEILSGVATLGLWSWSSFLRNSSIRDHWLWMICPAVPTSPVGQWSWATWRRAIAAGRARTPDGCHSPPGSVCHPFAFHGVEIA